MALYCRGLEKFNLFRSSIGLNPTLVKIPTLGDYDDEEIGGVMIGRGNQSTWRKPAPLPRCPPQTSHATREASD
jgi:hypothetical protein